MSEKSYNSARAVGILPHHNMKPLPIGAIPDYATVKIFQRSSENEENIVYTVPANTIFYLVSLSISVKNTTGDIQNFRTFMFDSNDNLIYKFVQSILMNYELYVSHFQPAIPMPLNEGYYIKQYSPSIDLNVYSSFFGYEVG